MFKNVAIKISLNLLLSTFNKIPFVPIRNFLVSQIQLVRNCVEILTDKDPNDKEQFEELWKEKRESFSDAGLVSSAFIAHTKIKNEFIRQMVVTALLELADNEGQPISEDLKALYPELFGIGGDLIQGRGVVNGEFYGRAANVPGTGEVKERKKRITKAEKAALGAYKEAARLQEMKEAHEKQKAVDSISDAEQKGIDSPVVAAEKLAGKKAKK